MLLTMNGYVAMLNIRGVFCTDLSRHRVTFIWDKTLNIDKRGRNER